MIGKFAVCKKATPGIGWWVGEILVFSGGSYQISLVWVPGKPEREGGTLSAPEKYFDRFETREDAIKRVEDLSGEKFAVAV
jgi:hypothetical protein